MTKVPDDLPSDATLLTAFDDIFNASLGLDPKVDKMLFNIKIFINKYIELDI